MTNGIVESLLYRYICVMETDITWRSCRHRPRPAYHEDSTSESLLAGDSSDVSVDDQSDATVDLVDDDVSVDD